MLVPKRRGAVALAIALLFGALEAIGAPGTDIASQRARLATLRSQLAALDSQAAAAAVAHNRALDRLDLIRARLRRATVDIGVARRDHRVAQRRLAARLSAAYRQPSPSILSVVLSSGSVSNLIEASDAISRVSELDAQTIAAVRARQRRLDALRRQLVADRAEAAAQLAAAQTRRSEVNALIAHRRSALARADRDLRQALARERQRLARLAAQKRTSNSRLPVRQATTGVSRTGPALLTAGAQGRVFPIAGSTNFRDDWLAARAGGRLHEGIDLFARRGTPAVAIADGTLFRVGWNRLGGWRLWLRDNAGTEYYYAHLDAFATAAREGARVAAGTVIGYVGDSGDAKGTSPHVHFEIHPGGGGPVRPYPIVAGLPRV
jgi:murein DD-endopeptidase MepM/ murein hydrolase activator NlpD